MKSRERSNRIHWTEHYISVLNSLSAKIVSNILNQQYVKRNRIAAKQVLDKPPLLKRYPASSVIEKCFMVCSWEVTIAQSAQRKHSPNAWCKVEKTSSIHGTLLQEPISSPFKMRSAFITKKALRILRICKCDPVWILPRETDRIAFIYLNITLWYCFLKLVVHDILN